MTISIKGFYHGLLTFVQKKSIENTVAYYDKTVSTDGVFLGYEFVSGIVQSKEILTPSEEFDDYGISNSRNVNLATAEIIGPVVEYFKPLILDYLGTDCRLDDIYMFWFNPEFAKKKSISGSWHDDNCGHRLKIFICLQGDGKTPTALIPDSHKRKYKFLFSEFLRFIGIVDNSPKEREILLRYRTGDAAIFDTNAMHRGLYEEPASPRTIIVVEFMNRYKSNKISGRAPCAPGSSPEGVVSFDALAYERLKATGLIDIELIRRDGDTFNYSLSNLNIRH